MKIYNITLLTDEADIVLKELPVKFVYKDSKVLGAIALFFGGSFVFIPLAYLVKTIASGEPLAGALPLLAVTVIFSPLFILGLNLIKKTKEMIISSQSISKKYTTLFKQEEWEEPIDAYQGVLMRTDVQATGERGSTLIYALDLLHQDQTKTVRLFKSMEYNTAFGKWKDYCQLFNRPSLERVGKDKIIRRDCKELGKPLVDMVKEGAVVLYKTPPPQPPEVEIKTNTKGETIVLPNKTELVMGKNALTIKQDTFWKSENSFEYAAVRAVLIDFSKSSKKWGWAIVIIERSSTHRSVFAHDLPYHVLEWLQFYLTTEIIKRTESSS